jgi:hypothetical protein
MYPNWNPIFERLETTKQFGLLSDYLVSWSGRSGRLSPKVTVWGRDGTPEDVVGHYVAQLLKGLVNERRIFERRQAQRRRAGEGEHHAPARGGMEPVLRRLAHHRRAEGVGDDEAGVRRKNLARHVERGGEKQPIAMQPIIEPLLVGTKVGNRRLDLDDPQFAVGAEGHEIGAPARRQRQFAHHRKPKRMQQPRGAARDRERSRGWPAVDGQNGSERVDAHGMK